MPVWRTSCDRSLLQVAWVECPSLRGDGGGQLTQHSAMRDTRVLLADDHRSFAEALGLRLDAEPGLRVVGAVVDPAVALSIVRGHPVDVAVLAVESMHCTFLTLADELLKA